VNDTLTTTLGLSRSRHRVWTQTEHPLPPVVISIHSGSGFSFQEYYTPEEAEQLVVLLAEAARLARDDEFARTAP
jgi:hypothetical protein